MTRKIVACAIALHLLACNGPLLANPDNRCSSCGRAFKQGYQIDGKLFCSEHWREALPLCANCGDGIQGNYSVMGASRRTFCSSCAANHPVCFFCAGPADLGRGGTRLPDGRPVCALDLRQSVFEPQLAASLFEQAVQETVSTFGPNMALKTPVKEVKLVDLEGLIAAAQGQYPKASLMSGRMLGLTTLALKSRAEKRWAEAATVHLLNGVPAERMLTVCLHEYAHIWQAENHPHYASTTPIMREGFAEWVAYKVSERQRRDEQVTQLENRQEDVYFQGLMKFRELERKVGVLGVLRYALGEQDLEI